jgi:hypothetical protein
MGEFVGENLPEEVRWPAGDLGVETDDAARGEGPAE